MPNSACDCERWLTNWGTAAIPSPPAAAFLSRPICRSSFPPIFGDIVLADVQLAHITLVDFDSNDDSPQYTTNSTIFIDKDSDSENIDVKMEQEDPSSFDTSFSQFNVTGTVDPKAFVEAIVVLYPDHKVSYPIALFSARQWQSGR